LSGSPRPANPDAKFYYNPHDHVELERWGYYYSYLRMAMMSTYCLAEEGDDCSCAPITIAGRPYWVRARGEIFTASASDALNTLSAKMLKRFGFDGGVSTGPVDDLGSTTGPKLADICNWYTVGYETGTKFPDPTTGVLNGLQECSAFNRNGYYYWGKQDLILSAFCVPGEDDCNCASVNDEIAGMGTFEPMRGRDARSGVPSGGTLGVFVMMGVAAWEEWRAFLYTCLCAFACF
jgi:hypothetical protein